MFVPDCIFETFDEITPAFLKEHGIRCILCDIDNTLVTYDDAEPTERVLAWLSLLRSEGIDVIFLSNNKSDRAKIFAEKLPNKHYAPAKKPLTKMAKRALAENGYTVSECAVLGDQIFTDILTGDFLGAPLTLLVPPIKDLTNLFFRTKRFLEKPFLRSYRRREEKRKKDNQ